MREDLKNYIDEKIKVYNKVFLPNSFPFADITFSELENLFTYLAERKIIDLTIARRIKWQFDKLPDNLSLIKTLKNLAIDNSILKSIPETIGELENLEKLTIRRTQIKYLPSSISNLKNLNTLNLSYSQIATLPNLKHMNKLERLILNNTRIIRIPDYLCKLDTFKIIDVRNLELDYFPACIIDKRIQIKTNDVVNLGLIHKEKDVYRVHIKIQDEIKTVIKQYLSYFSQYVKRAKKEMIDFYLSDTVDGFSINFKVTDEDELENIKSYLSEYMSFTEKKEDEVVPLVVGKPSAYDMTMLALELRQQIRHYSSMLESTKDNLKVVSATLGIPYNELEHVSASTMIQGFQQLTEATPISNIYLEQTQQQSQYQIQSQTQELRNYLESLTGNLSEIIDLIEDPKLKEEGEKVLNDIYPVVTQPTEKSISDVGMLPKLKNFSSKVRKAVDFIDDTKETYNKFVENYNGIAKIEDLDKTLSK